MLNLDQAMQLGDYEYLEVERTWLVDTLRMLADFGEQAATGEFFVLHLGI